MRRNPLPLFVLLVFLTLVSLTALGLSLSAAAAQPATVYRVQLVRPTPYHPVSLTTLERRLYDLHARHAKAAARHHRLLALVRRRAVMRSLDAPATVPATYMTPPPVTTTTAPYVYTAPESTYGYVDPASLPAPWDCIVSVESNGTDAQNPTSSASGYFQFLDSTWTAVSGLAAPASAYSFAEQYAVAQEAPLSSWEDGCT